MWAALSSVAGRSGKAARRSADPASLPQANLSQFCRRTATPGRRGALSEHLGHWAPGFTQRTYTHLQPLPPPHDKGGTRKPRPHRTKPRSGPDKAIGLMPRLMQPMAEVLPLVQRLEEAGG